MKRCLITLWFVGMAFLGSMAQKPITGFFNIPGHMKSSYSWRDEVNVKKGTPCTLQFVTRLKKYEPGEVSLQVIMAEAECNYGLQKNIFGHRNYWKECILID